MADQQPTADDPDRTIRYPDIQKVIDEHFNRWPISDPDRQSGGGR